MQPFARVVESEVGRDHWLFLCSDLHIGSRAFSRKHLVRDLDDARRVNARILINGDVFDAIDYRDKRFSPDCLDPEIPVKRDMINEVVKHAAGILQPYADLIDFIGVGNHEMKWAKWNAADPVGMLLTSLNAGLAETSSTHRIVHGGICGFYHTAFRFKGTTVTAPHTLFYHHGVGGDAPITKGVIGFSRIEKDVEADLYTMGHKHHKTVMEGTRLKLGRFSKMPVKHTYLSVQTASYYENYLPPVEGDPLAFTYAEEALHPSKPMGGWFVRLRPVRKKSGLKSKGTETTWNTVEQGFTDRPA